MIEEKEILIGEINNDVIHVYPELQEKEVTPIQEQQEVTPDENVYGLSKVVVDAIPSEYVIPSGTININSGGLYNVKNYESANVTDKWASVGYSSDPTLLSMAYNEALSIYNAWDESTTSMMEKYLNNKNLIIFPLINISNVSIMTSVFNGCSNLEEIPLLDTSNVEYMVNAFKSCNKLKILPALNTKKVKTMKGAFSNCQNLTDESLNNILKMCIDATQTYTATKTLNDLQLPYYSYSTSIESLPNYQAFINAGWSIY